MKQGSLAAFFLIFLINCTYGQSDDRSWNLNGYVKDLITFNVNDSGDSILVDNLIHNRLNFEWFATDKMSIRVDLRNRVFTGDLVDIFPNYGALIDVNDDYFDLSKKIVNKDKIVIHSVFDRAYLEYNGTNYQIRAGRQRINWGINLAWNPNDIFNAYSFFDFDYEERPGSDAVRFQRFIGYAGGIELAIKMADSFEELIAAGMFKWNLANYDFQLMSGVMRNNFVTGGGWAGNIHLSGFKGEFTFLVPLEGDPQMDLISSISFDHSFANSLYLNGSFLYNSAADEGSLLFQSSANLDIRSLSPYKWSSFAQVSYQFTPLFVGGLSTLYFPNEPGIFVNPYLTYSISTNLDFDAIGQFYIEAEPQSLTFIYGRLKYSF